MAQRSGVAARGGSSAPGARQLLLQLGALAASPRVVASMGGVAGGHAMDCEMLQAAWFLRWALFGCA